MSSSIFKSDTIETKRIILKPNKSSLKWDSTNKHDHVSVQKQYTAIAKKSADKQFIFANESFETHTKYKWVLTINSDCSILAGVSTIKNDAYCKQIMSTKGDKIRFSADNTTLKIYHESKNTKVYTIEMPRFITVFPWICGTSFNISISNDSYSELISEPDGSFTILNQTRGVNNKARIDKHMSDTTIHYPQRHIDHKKIQNSGKYLHNEIDKHIDDKNTHYVQEEIDHDKLKNSGRFSHVELDKHLSNDNIHFTERSILHDNIANSGIFSHPQIDTHIRRNDIHFSLKDIDHRLIKNSGKHSHDEIDFHLKNTLIHNELNDLAISKNNVWSAKKITDCLNELDANKLGVVSGTINTLNADKIHVSTLEVSDRLIVNGVSRVFDKQLYGSWLYSDIFGCILAKDIPFGGSYVTINALTTVGNSGGSSCLYKTMCDSGLPEINTINRIGSGELLIDLESPRLCEIDFHICVKPTENASFVYRLNIGENFYYYPQTRKKNITAESSGKVLLVLSKKIPISLSIGSCDKQNVGINIFNVMLSIKTFV